VRNPFRKGPECGYEGCKVRLHKAGNWMRHDANRVVEIDVDTQKFAKDCHVHSLVSELPKRRPKINSAALLEGIENPTAVDIRWAEIAVNSKYPQTQARALEHLGKRKQTSSVSVEIISEVVAQAVADRIAGKPTKPREPTRFEQLETETVKVHSAVIEAPPAPPPVRTWENSSPATRMVLGLKPVWDKERRELYKGSWAEQVHGPRPWSRYYRWH